MAPRRNWTDTEVSEALALYLRLPFGQFDKGNPKVQMLAARIARTPSAVALKLANLAALDASIPQKGMANASSTDRRVWNAFLNDPIPVLEAYQTQVNVAHPLPQQGFSEAQRAVWQERQDTPNKRWTEQRQGQNFFRDMILTSYRGRCALTGVEETRLLTASHIIGWQEDPQLRLNPNNGICLNALHDRAFDRHLISFDDNYRMIIAKDVPDTARRALERDGATQLSLPDRFLPDMSFLQRHRQRMEARLS